jgi:hypothetical protein
MKFDEAWCVGFFEGQTSFSVNIGLSKSKNKRYVVFKPTISIVSVDIDQVKFLTNFFNLQTRISRKKKKQNQNYLSDYFTLQIQSFEDIDTIIAHLKDHSFKSGIKNQKFSRFVDCYEDIKSMGHIHSVWIDAFDDVIRKKLSINSSRSNINKLRYSEEDWVKRIKEHLVMRDGKKTND